jgi:subtilisin family serine protease
MLKRIAKWFLIGLSVVLGIIVVGVAALLFLPRFDAISTTSFTLTPIAARTLSPLPATYPKIDRTPARDESLSSQTLTALPRFDLMNFEGDFPLDLRQANLAKLDLRDRLTDLLMATFDEGTVWPFDDRLPANFDPQHILELGKNPGLGVRELHMAGITGRGVGIGIIDYPLLTLHREYADRLQVYEETSDIAASAPAVLHGTGVTSLAAGKTLGVAPEADVYFIATRYDNVDSREKMDFAYLARGIRRLLEINRTLPPDRKIRVISMSVGWDNRGLNYAELKAAIDEAQAAGILLVSTTMEDMYNFRLGPGLGRVADSDPDQFSSYTLGLIWPPPFVLLDRATQGDTVCTPMDSRTTASPTGADEYVFYRVASLSWSVPYFAGTYALAAQADPQITPERFLALTLRTGRRFPYGIIVDPVALIKAIQHGD